MLPVVAWLQDFSLTFKMLTKKLFMQTVVKISMLILCLPGCSPRVEIKILGEFEKSPEVKKDIAVPSTDRSQNVGSKIFSKIPFTGLSE